MNNFHKFFLTMFLIMFTMFYCAMECEGANHDDTLFVWTYLIYREHELVYETDTVDCTYMSKVGREWYLKGTDGINYWSDRHPKLIRRRISCPW